MTKKAKKDYRPTEEMDKIISDFETWKQQGINLGLKHNIDPWGPDTISGLEVYKLVKNYDKNFNVNHARTGEDGCSGDKNIEFKSHRLENRFGTFMFHVNGDIHHDRFVFLIWDKVYLKAIRFYDISDPQRIKTIHFLLENKVRDYFLKHGKTVKRDTMNISEKELLNLFPIDFPRYYLDNGIMGLHDDQNNFIENNHSTINFITDFKSELLPYFNLEQAIAA